MDIDVALQRMRELCDANASEEMSIVFESIDGWLSRGGFLPGAWERNR